MRIVIDIETADLPAFHEPSSEVPGGGYSNIWNFLNIRLRPSVLDLPDIGKDNFKELRAICESEKLLAERILAAVKFDPEA